MNSWHKVLECDLPQIANELREVLETPALILLSGPVGAGKTTFAKHFMPQEDILSPTYSIIHEIENCVHADLYRLNDVSELIHLELSLYLEDKEYFLVEWGKEYWRQLKKIVGDEFNYYELVISIETLASGEQTRSYELSKLE